jgi:hypothetical protein
MSGSWALTDFGVFLLLYSSPVLLLLLGAIVFLLSKRGKQWMGDVPFDDNTYHIK